MGWEGEDVRMLGNFFREVVQTVPIFDLMKYMTKP